MIKNESPIYVNVSHGYDATVDGPLSSTHCDGQREFFRATSRAFSGNFGSLSTNDSFASYEPSHWCNMDMIPDYPSDDEMVSQVKRLESFRDWPASCPVKPRDLAAAGFYYTQNADNVRCFRCNLTLQKWQAGDDPMEEHKNLRPACPFVRENTVTHRYPGITYANHPPGPTSQVGARPGYLPSGMSSDPPDQRLAALQIDERMGGATLVMPGNEPGSLVGSMAPSSVHYGYRHPYESAEPREGVDRSMDEQNPPGHESIPVEGEHHIYSFPPGSQLSISSGGLGPVRVTSQQGVVTRLPAEVSSSSLQGGHVAAAQAAQSGASGLVVLLSRARPMANVAFPVVDPTLEEGRAPLFRQEEARHVSTYADLASEHHRLTTFVDWPQDSAVRPWELSEAGFYYMGTGDGVKCFRCGIELANWEPEDTPWGEHQRWSPHCPLVVEHFRGRTQVAPAESTGSPVVRRSSGQSWSAVTFSGSREPAMPLPTLSSGGSSFRSGESIANPPFGQPGPENVGCQEMGSSSVAPSSPSRVAPPSVPGHAPGAADVDRLVSMGFARDQVTQAIRQKILTTGANFSSFDALLEALLIGRRATTVPFPSSSSSIARYSVLSQLPALPLENEELPPGSASSPNSPSPRIEGLRRSLSEPQGGYPGGTEDEKDESLQQKLNRMREERTCKICMDAEVGVVFLPCGHLSCCPGCAAGMEQCPMCRTPIQEKVRTYLSWRE